MAADGRRTKATVIVPDEGLELPAGPNRITLKLTAEHTPRFSLVDYQVGPGFAAPPELHYHTKEDWAAYVSEGTLTFVFEDGEVEAPTGSIVFVPAEAPFAWRNDSDEPARYLAIYAPAGFEGFFVEVVEGITALGGAAPEVIAEVIPPLWEKYEIGTV